MAREIFRKRIGTEVKLNTEFPIYAIIEKLEEWGRYQAYTLCNGIAARAEEFATKRQALAYADELVTLFSEASAPLHHERRR